MFFIIWLLVRTKTIYSLNVASSTTAQDARFLSFNQSGCISLEMLLQWAKEKIINSQEQDLRYFFQWVFVYAQI